MIKMLLITLACLNMQVLQAESIDDSTNKAAVVVIQPEHSLRQRIVEKTIEQYVRWRKDSLLREQDSAAASILQEYWSSVGKTFSVKNYSSFDWQEAHPWSAVFISYILKQAGASDQFRYSETHSTYIVWARENAEKHRSDAVFEAYHIEDSSSAWPQPGDILCKNRDGKSYSLNNITNGCISHCDIVVEVDTIAKAVYTIGGNLNNTVAKRLVWLDSNGKIDKQANWILFDEELENREGGQADYFGIIRIKNKQNPVAVKTH